MDKDEVFAASHPQPRIEIRRWEFTVTLSGIGDDISEGWQDAVTQFSTDPGAPPDEGNSVRSYYEELEG